MGIFGKSRAQRELEVRMQREGERAAEEQRQYLAEIERQYGGDAEDDFESETELLGQREEQTEQDDVRDDTVGQPNAVELWLDRLESVRPADGRPTEGIIDVVGRPPIVLFNGEIAIEGRRDDYDRSDYNIAVASRKSEVAGQAKQRATLARAALQDNIAADFWQSVETWAQTEL